MASTDDPHRLTISMGGASSLRSHRDCEPCGWERRPDTKGCKAGSRADGLVVISAESRPPALGGAAFVGGRCRKGAFIPADRDRLQTFDQRGDRGDARLGIIHVREEAAGIACLQD